MILEEGKDCKGRPYKRIDIGKVRRDLTKEYFEHFKVLFRVQTDIGDGVYYLCQCECKNLFIARGPHLTANKILSCGCIGKQRRDESHLIDITNQTYGELTAIKRIIQNGETYWKCNCSCGRQTLVKLDNLRSGNTKSCGHLKNQRNDLTGKRFGKWLVLGDYQHIHSHSYYKCKCDCGMEKLVRADELIGGKSYSCGCENQSRGVRKINNLLQENNIFYKSEATFSNLISPRKVPLRYDFTIIENNKIIRLLEYDGELHYKANYYYGGEEELKYHQLCDNIKNQYAKQHNIPLVRISYTNLDKFSYEDLFNDKYLV